MADEHRRDLGEPCDGQGRSWQVLGMDDVRRIHDRRDVPGDRNGQGSKRVRKVADLRTEQRRPMTCFQKSHHQVAGDASRAPMASQGAVRDKDPKAFFHAGLAGMSLDLKIVASAHLVVAHPGHELRVHGWFQRQRPTLSILAMGSRSGSSQVRLEASGRAAVAVDAPRGPLFGRLLDRDLYAHLMTGRSDVFGPYVDELADAFVSSGAELVVVDGWQRYSAAHDIAHVIGRLAARKAALALGRPISVLEYSVVSQSLAALHPAAISAQTLDLGPDETTAKDLAIVDHPDIESELAEIVAMDGRASLEKEAFFEPAPIEHLLRPQPARAYYETAGEDRVRRGIYPQVLRESEVAAVIRALLDQELAEREPLRATASAS